MLDRPVYAPVGKDPLCPGGPGSSSWKFSVGGGLLLLVVVVWKVVLLLEV